MVDQSSAVGSTGTQQFGAGGTSTPDSGNVVQNLPAGGTSGGEESELQKLRREKEALSDQVGQLKNEKAEAEGKVVAANQSVADKEAMLARVKDGLEKVNRALRDEVFDLHTRLCDVLQANGNASVASQLHAMRVEVESLRAAKDAAVAETTDMRGQLDRAVQDVDMRKKLSEQMIVELKTRLTDVEKARDEASERVMKMRKSWFARRRDIEVPS